jgi:(p)ppGpp synthase/HD superfamily hydrolase
MNDVKLAEAIATDAHRGQVDKLGADYISHPRRVAEQFDPELQPDETCVGWLHDVIEDTAVTPDDLLAKGFTPEVVDAVVLLTRRKDVPSEEYYARIRENPVARAVKIADIADNTAPWRTAQLDDETRERLAKKYANALIALGANDPS